jgi:uncharacterized membrane protein (DUF485 family)
LTIVNLSIGPIVSGTAYSYFQVDLGTLNCKKKKDDWDTAKDQPNANDDAIKYYQEYEYNACQREKGMHDMEYTAFIFDVVIGFICGLLGLLHIFEVKKDFVSNTGLIGLICGVIGFVLTLVYVIFNGLVYTTIYVDSIEKRDGDYVIAEKDGNTYKCLFFDDKNNINSKYPKISDLGKKQYNYDKDIIKDDDDHKFDNCKDINSANSIATLCTVQEKIEGTYATIYTANECGKIYVYNIGSDLGIENKDLSDRFLTTLILSLFVCLASIGLALFGFLLFRTPGDF